MLAVDTNVLVRLLVRDDPAQAARAQALFQIETIYLCTTVLLETEWVLRRAYRYSDVQVRESLSGIADLPNVVLQNAKAVFQALTWMEGGTDFADALHLAQAADCDAFASFDRQLARAAARQGAVPVRAP